MKEKHSSRTDEGMESVLCFDGPDAEAGRAEWIKTFMCRKSEKGWKARKP